MKTKVWYDGFEITQYCTVRHINKSLAPTYVNRFMGLDNVHGSNFIGGKLAATEVSIDVTIPYNVQYNLDNLNLILYQREPKPLIISDNPDRYLMAILDGDTSVTHHKRFGDFTLKFVSENSYWGATSGFDTSTFGSNGRVVVNNRGTAPTPPVIDLTFTSDCGYLGLVAPNGFMALGSAKEQDVVSVNPTEVAMNEPMTSTSGWTRITNAQTYIPDYIKMSSTGTARHDSQGMLLNTSTLGTSDQWHGHAYMKNFTAGAHETEADNFELTSKVEIADLSGTRNNTMAMLMVVMDVNNNPIMTTSIYDVTHDRNKLVVTFKTPESGNIKRSKIIHTGSLDSLSGRILMKKSGNTFSWEVYSNASTVVSPPKVLKVGDTVHIKSSTTTIYDWNGRGLRIADYIKGKPLKITQVGTGVHAGMYLLSSPNWAEGYIRANDLMESNVAGTTTTTKAQSVKHTVKDNALAQLRPYKVFIWQAKWGATQPYTKFVLDDIQVLRKYTTSSIDLDNTFVKGDNLIIDNRDGQVLLNGRTFTGFVDYDSRFFDVDGGLTEIALHPSSWSTMPTGKVSLESRWL